METNDATKKIEQNIERYKRVLARKGFENFMKAIRSSIAFLEKAERKLDQAKLREKGGLEGRSRDELYEMAKELEIQGRSKMSKVQLRKKLAEKLYH